MSQKNIGIIILVISILLFIVLYSFTAELNKYLHSACITPEGFCPHQGSLPPQSYAGFTITLVMAIYGLYLVFSGGRIQKVEARMAEETTEAVKNLTVDEKKIYEAVKANNGLAFQGELVRQSEFTKVKVSRVLDSLEAKGLTERKRRGMSNVVVLR